MADELVYIGDDYDLTEKSLEEQRKQMGLPKIRKGFPLKAGKWKKDRYYALDPPRQAKDMALKAEGYETKSEKGLLGIGATLYYRRPWWYPFE